MKRTMLIAITLLALLPLSLIHICTTSGVYGVAEPHECYMPYTTERAEKAALTLYQRDRELLELICCKGYV